MSQFQKNNNVGFNAISANCGLIEIKLSSLQAQIDFYHLS